MRRKPADDCPSVFLCAVVFDACRLRCIPNRTHHPTRRQSGDRADPVIVPMLDDREA